MDNRKMLGGLILLIAAGALAGLALSSKKRQQDSSNFGKKSNRLTKDLKEKFNEFVDQLHDKVRAVLK
jgi:hypothetical protein